MELNEYQYEAKSTAVYPGQGEYMGANYCTMKMNGEAGEIAEKIGKIWRDNGGVITDEHRAALLKELGDVLWYVANLASELGYSLDLVAETNIAKLTSRKERGVIQGSGDDR